MGVLNDIKKVMEDYFKFKNSIYFWYIAQKEYFPQNPK